MNLLLDPFFFPNQFRSFLEVEYSRCKEIVIEEMSLIAINILKGERELTLKSSDKFGRSKRTTEHVVGRFS